MSSDGADKACRILLVAPTVDDGLIFIERIKTLSDDFALTVNGDSPSTPDLDGYSPILQSENTNLYLHSWNIRNKYYTASVHFAICHSRNWRVIHAFGVPAVVVLWTNQAELQDVIERVHTDLAGSNLEPEVCLAVRLDVTPAAADSVMPFAAPIGPEEDAIDELLANLGFEYVDARGDVVHRTIEMGSDVPGLPRVLDALSTIMWPSMIQAPRVAARRSRPMNLLGMNDDSFDEAGLAALIAEPESNVDVLSELERWLDEDAASQGPGTPSADGISCSAAPANGFDDDFAAFISAPPGITADSLQSVESLFEASGALGSGNQLDMSFDEHFDFSAPRSPFLPPTNSVKKRGNSAERAECTSHSDDDDDLPSQAEIHSMSAQLFGGGGTSTADTNFDLNRIFSSLASAKAEIAGIEDEDKRRQAAARVALGLVHGLGLDTQ